MHFKSASLSTGNGRTKDCSVFTVFLTIKTSSQNISITLLQILLEHRGGYWRKSSRERFWKRNTAASKIGNVSYMNYFIIDCRGSKSQIYFKTCNFFSFPVFVRLMCKKTRCPLLVRVILTHSWPRLLELFRRGVISLLWQFRCHWNPNHNKFLSQYNTAVVVIFPNLC